MGYIDLHCDTLMVYGEGEESLLENHKSINIRRLKKGGCLAQFFAVWLPDPETKALMSKKVGEDLSDQEWDDAYINLLLDGFYRDIQKSSGEIAPAFCLEDLKRNEIAGKISAFLTLEDGRAVDGSLEKLENLYRRGIRLITLTWNQDNCFGRANYRDGEPGSRGRGLTDFGKEAVLHMNDLGMLVDVSHLSDEGFYDVAEISRKPFVASHSNARALADCSRNLSDGMIRVLAGKGGVMGLNFAPGFLDEDFECQVSRVSRMAEHAVHIVNCGGEEVLALGSDLDGIEGNLEISSPENMDLLWDALRKKGFSQRQMDLFMCGNAQRVIGAVLK